VRVAIVGAGNVGGALGAAFARAGHQVVFGVRDPGSAKTGQALRAAEGSRADHFAAAIDGADVVVFALRWDAVPPTLAAIGNLEGVVVIDAMNRFGGDPTRSTAQDLADMLPGARVVKAFNTAGFENLSSAHERELPAAMFVAGDDAPAKQLALDLASQIGFVAYDVGGLENAKPLEDMVKVWLAITRSKSRRVAFAISED
jgi:predicted dinucleotide-binding enzyme